MIALLYLLHLLLFVYGLGPNKWKTTACVHPTVIILFCFNLSS